jgi:hypothetical protein
MTHEGSNAWKQVTGIGKNLRSYDAIDTGLFVCPTEIFAYLEQAKSNNGGNDCSLANGVELMALTAKCVGLISAPRAGTTSILREFWNTPCTTPAGAYCVRLTKIRRHFRLRAEITSAAWGYGIATAVSSPCVAIALIIRLAPAAIVQRWRIQCPDSAALIKEKENRDVALGQLKQPPHKSFAKSSRPE